MSSPALRVLNLGAGVQSSTLAMLASRGEFGLEKPECAIFADTGWESKGTYEFLDWLEKQLDFPVRRVRAAGPGYSTTGLKEDMMASLHGGRFCGVPLYTESNNGGGQLRRQFTREYKITPIERECRKILGVKRVSKNIHVEQWFGISKDEIFRVKESPTPWIKRRWPLVFDIGWTRQDCKRWWEKEGLPVPPRSACIGCPYHNDAEWRQMRDERADEWAEAVEFDVLIRTGVRGTKEKCYLHRAMKPLSEVDLSTPEDHGQLSLFTGECEGMCGV